MEWHSIIITTKAIQIPLLMSHSPLNCKQDYKISKLLSLATNHDTKSHPFPAEDHGIGFGGSDSYFHRFTICCKPCWCKLEANTWWSQQTHHVKKAELKFCLCMEIMSIMIMNRISDKGEPWRSPRSTRNEFNLLLVVPAMLVQGPNGSYYSNRQDTPSSWSNA